MNESCLLVMAKLLFHELAMAKPCLPMATGWKFRHQLLISTKTVSLLYHLEPVGLMTLFELWKGQQTGDKITCEDDERGQKEGL